jgi:hypothetical protein
MVNTLIESDDGSSSSGEELPAREWFQRHDG